MKGAKKMTNQNLYIIPYSTEEDYRDNVNIILKHLISTAGTDEIIITEGEYSYIDHQAA